MLQLALEEYGMNVTNDSASSSNAHIYILVRVFLSTLVSCFHSPAADPPHLTLTETLRSCSGRLKVGSWSALVILDHSSLSSLLSVKQASSETYECR